MSAFEWATLVLSVIGVIGTPFSIVVWQRINTAHDVANKAKDDLADFKLYVAREHSTNGDIDLIGGKFDKVSESIFSLIERLRGDINEMGNSFRDRLNDKVDK